MKQITLNINDSMFEHFLYLIKHIDASEVQIIDQKQIDDLDPVSSIKSKVNALLQKNPGVFAEIDDPVSWQQEQRNEW